MGEIIMRATREEQRTEALKRLNSWKTDGFLQMAFENNKLAVCERFHGLTGSGFIEASELPKEILAQVRELEERHGLMAYAAIKTETEFGLLYDILYVCKDKEDWEMDAELMEDNVAMSYCINTTEPAFSEFGTIGLASMYGGLYRAF